MTKRNIPTLHTAGLGAAARCDDPVQPCPLQKTVTARIASLTFRSDHLDSTSQKQLRPSPGDYKDATARFAKPEWTAIPSKSDPISHTKNQETIVDIDIDFRVEPEGCVALLRKVKGDIPDPYLQFEMDLCRTVRTERVTLTGLRSKGKLPNHVDLVDGKTITWSIIVDGNNQPIGGSGPHRIYVTHDKPIGKMASSTPNHFTETGDIQDVTEERLAYSVDASRAVGVHDEKECVDAVFSKLLSLGVVYSLGRRWEPGSVNNTGILPKPTLHHYLWRCNAATAEGECHNIAPAFVLACRILGVKDPFEVGFMYPWPARWDNHPSYDRRGDSILGKYNSRYVRSHAGEGHGSETCLFIDGNNWVNNFEGVARYRTAILYAIGEARYDVKSTADENSSIFYCEHNTDSTGKVTGYDLTRGGFELCFLSSVVGYCRKPYPSKTTLVSYAQPAGWTLVCAPFYWHE